MGAVVGWLLVLVLAGILTAVVIVCLVPRDAETASPSVGDVLVRWAGRAGHYVTGGESQLARVQRELYNRSIEALPRSRRGAIHLPGRVDAVVSPADAAGIAGFEGVVERELADELRSYVAKFARTSVAAPTVRVTCDPTLRDGEVRIELSQPTVFDGPPPGPATEVFPSSVVLLVSDKGVAAPLLDRALVAGRSAACDLVVADPAGVGTALRVQPAGGRGHGDRCRVDERDGGQRGAHQRPRDAHPGRPGHHRHHDADRHESVMRLHLRADGATHPGRRRANADAWASTCRRAVLSDGAGMWGVPAANEAVQAAMHVPPGSLTDAVRAADGAVHDVSVDAFATLVAVEVGGSGDGTAELEVANVGDSRCLLAPVDGGCRWLTEPHNGAADLVRAGVIGADEVAGHPFRHHLTRSLGADDAAPDVMSITVAAGDRLLLVTDGVHASLDLSALARLLDGGGPGVAASIVLAAFAEGATDNMTAVVLDVVDGGLGRGDRAG